MPHPSHQLSLNQHLQLQQSRSPSPARSRMPSLFSSPNCSGSDKKDITDLHQQSNSSCKFLESGHNKPSEVDQSEKVNQGKRDNGDDNDGGDSDNELREADCVFEMV